MNPLMLSSACLALASAALLLAPSARAEPASYPVVLSDDAVLKEIGLDLRSPDVPRQPTFPNTCYDYGQASTVYLISLSDAFLAKWKKRGFTRESVCLAIVSEARFDPETGRRLPTFILRDDAAIKAALNGRAPDKLTDEQVEELTESGLLTEELPLAFPPCFRNGTPYLDCDWRYGMKSGRKLPSSTTAHMRTFGEKLDIFVKDAMRSDKYYKHSADETKPYLPITGYWGQSEAYPGQPADKIIADKHWSNLIDYRWLVIAPAFPSGYGYALNATGELGPGISIRALRDGLDGRRILTRLTGSILRRDLDD